MKIFDVLKDLVKDKESVIPKGHHSCPDCDGTGDYGVWIDCLTYDGEGKSLKKILPIII